MVPYTQAKPRFVNLRVFTLSVPKYSHPDSYVYDYDEDDPKP